MPTYEYECKKCGHEFELFQGINDEPKKRCPKCKGKVVRLPGIGSGIIFKGSGFYATDYRSDSYMSGAKSDTPKTETTKPKKSAKKTEGSKKTSQKKEAMP